VIHELFRDICKAEYTGKLKISKLDPIGYEVQIFFNTDYEPYVIYAELDDKNFMKLLCSEFQSSRFKGIFYGKCTKIMPLECGKINTKCSCNDKG
jgi:uncharacterized Zn finger protein